MAVNPVPLLRDDAAAVPGAGAAVMCSTPALGSEAPFRWGRFRSTYLVAKRTESREKAERGVRRDAETSQNRGIEREK